MRYLTWSDTLSVDVDEIDDDHRKLVNLFNLFAHAINDGESLNYQEALLEELISCTAWHFKHEERLMVKYGYKDFAEHKKEHEELINGVDEIRQLILSTETPTTDKDIESLESWLVEHILVTDMKLGAFLANAI